MLNRAWWQLVCIVGASLLLDLSVSDRYTTGVPVKILGIQPGRTFKGFDWHDEQLSALRRAEYVGPDVVIWPERGYPFLERINDGLKLRHLECHHDYARIFGMHAKVDSGRVTNTVIVQPACGTPSSFRHKERLAPIYEVDRLESRRTHDSIMLNGLRLTLPICYEILDRQYVLRAGGDWIINISADSFDPTGSASIIMVRAAWLRAVEFHVPVVRVSDVSFSAIFDSSGRMIDLAKPGDATVHASLSLAPRAMTRPRWQAISAAVVLVVLGAGSDMLLRIRRVSMRVMGRGVGS